MELQGYFNQKTLFCQVILISGETVIITIAPKLVVGALAPKFVVVALATVFPSDYEL